jgi:hypothetical protein
LNALRGQPARTGNQITATKHCQPINRDDEAATGFPRGGEAVAVFVDVSTVMFRQRCFGSDVSAVMF